MRDYDLPAQRQDALLYLAGRVKGAADRIFSELTVHDFDPGYRQRLAALVIELLGEDLLDPMQLQSRAVIEGGSDLANFNMLLPEPATSNTSLLVKMVREDTARRDWTANLTRALADVSRPESDVEGVVGVLAAQMDSGGAASLTGLPRRTLTEMLNISDEERPWVIPNTLRQGEVLLLTGEEGQGKSLFVSQIALGAAYGINTLTTKYEQHEPVRVLVIDVENEDIQIRDNMRKIHPFMVKDKGTINAQIEFSQHKFLDLTNPADKRKAVNEAIDFQPQLVVMGTVYKLAPTPHHDEAFNSVMTTVRAITAKTNAGFIIEHHAGNAKDGSGEREHRPYGSSMWRRWPNFGVGLVRRKDDWRTAELIRWRGERARGRNWPAGLREGPTYPWLPIAADEWEALYK